MKVTISAKLKLHLSADQKQQMDELCFAYRGAINYASQIAFDNDKCSDKRKIQDLTYYDIRETWGLPSTVTCGIAIYTAGNFKSLKTKLRQSEYKIEKAREKGYKNIPKLFRGLEKAPKYSERTANIYYKKDFTFKKDSTVSICTLDKRIKVQYSAYQKHLDLINSPNSDIGGARIWYDKAKKQYYLIVALSVNRELNSNNISKLVAYDSGQRILASILDNEGSNKFYKGGQVCNQQRKYSRLRRRLTKKGTKSAKRKLKKLSGKERRFKQNVNHFLANQIVKSNSIIGFENLTGIRSNIKRKTGKNASEKQRKSNDTNSKWAFAELNAYVTYKAQLANSIPVKLNPYMTSKMCPKCGHTSHENRPNGAKVFKCVVCFYEANSDHVARVNLLNQLISKRYILDEMGSLSTCPIDVSRIKLVDSSELKVSAEISCN